MPDKMVTHTKILSICLPRLRAAQLESAAKPTTLLVDVHQDTSTQNLLGQDPGISMTL